ncbi:MAG: asparaginase domain-containing protein, partial [Limnohabitans sp.]
DGPANLLDALWLAQHTEANGVCVVFNAQAHHALNVQKISTDPLAAFSSGFAPLAAEKQDGDWVWLSSSPESITYQMPSLNGFLNANRWPRVEWLTHHAGNDGEMVEALLSAQSHTHMRGLVVAGTGAGTFKDTWNAALAKAIGLGVKVWVSSRCAWGKPQPQAHQNIGELVNLPPAKACMALALDLMAQDEKKISSLKRPVHGL